MTNMPDQITALQSQIIWNDGTSKWSTLDEGDPKYLINHTLPFYKKFHKNQLNFHPTMEGHKYRLIKYEVIDEQI